MSRKGRKQKRLNMGKTALDAANIAIEKKAPDDIKIGKQIATRQSSVNFMSSIMNLLPNPDPVLKKLNKTIEVYEELLYDSRVKATTESRKSAILAMEWEIIGDGSSEEEKKFYTELFKTYKMPDTISEMLDGALFGYKPMEIVYAEVNRKIIPVEFVGKPSRWFDYDGENRLRYLAGNNTFEGVLVPPEKFIVIRKNPTYDNPYGKPALSPCYWPVIFRKNGMKFWTIFLEKFGMPFLMAKAPEGAKEDRICDVADMLENMVVDGIAVVPKEYDLEIAESAEGKGKTGSMHNVYLDFMNREIDMSILGNNLTTEVQGGSQAAATVHMEVRGDIIESDQKLVEEGFNELIIRTHAMNFTSEPPKFRLFAEEDIDQERADRDSKLQTADPRLKFTGDYYKKNYNFEDTDFKLEIVKTEGGDKPDG